MRRVEYTEIAGQLARPCARCGVIKPIDLFPWNSQRQEPRSSCFDCDNAYKREQARRRRALQPKKPKKPPPDTWTPEQDAALRQWARDPDMLTVPGRTSGACRVRCVQRGIKVRRHSSKWPDTPDEAAVVAAAVDKRISFNAIAKRHGLTRNTVAGIVWRWRQRSRS